MRLATLTLFACLIVAACLPGCSSGESPQQGAADDDRVSTSSTVQQALGGVAVVDLDEVAQRLGRDVEMSQAIAAKESDLNEKLAVLKQAFEEQFAKEQQLTGNAPNAQQTENLNALDRRLGIQIRQAQMQAQNEMALFRQSLAGRFREEVKPLAQRIAAQRGLSIVITENRPLLLSVAPEADITDEVVQQMLAASAKTTSEHEFPQVSNLIPRDGEFPLK